MSRATRVRVGAVAGSLALRALATTWRIRQVNDGPWRALAAARRPFIFAVWHGDLLAPTWAHRGQGVRAMVSQHNDGEIIARIIHDLGFETVRGSSSRGGVRALLEMIRTLETSGSAAVFTPDGPRGPRRELQPGILAAAQRAGVPIVAVGAAASRAWYARSWDRFCIPKPFARVCIVYSEPTLIAPAADALAAEAARVTALINACADAAAEWRAGA